MPAIDQDQFKRGMRLLAAGVTVITTVRDGVAHGLVATAVCSVCAEPPTLLACVNRSSSAHDPIRDSGRFCVNVLEQRQLDAARRFVSAPREERFGAFTLSTLATGAPVLDGALVSFDCEVAEAASAGTHTVFFGRIVAVRVSDPLAPLLYFNGGYATTAPLPIEMPSP